MCDCRFSAWCALMLLILAFLCQLVSFVGPLWVKFDKEGVMRGLWYECKLNVGSPDCEISTDVQGGNVKVGESKDKIILKITR